MAKQVDLNRTATLIAVLLDVLDLRRVQAADVHSVIKDGLAKLKRRAEGAADRAIVISYAIAEEADNDALADSLEEHGWTEAGLRKAVKHCRAATDHDAVAEELLKRAEKWRQLLFVEAPRDAGKYARLFEELPARYGKPEPCECGSTESVTADFNLHGNGPKYAWKGSFTVSSWACLACRVSKGRPVGEFLRALPDMATR